MDDSRAMRVVVSGRVQGVWFRAWTQARARELDLAGWVRNRRDGTVEALFSGSGAAVAAMVASCHEGPSRAVVSGVETCEAEPPEADEFTTLPTA